MRLTIFTAALTILFAPSLAAAAPPPVPMTPSGPWNVEFADSMCLLSRPYGNNRATALLLKPSMLGDSMEVIVARTVSPSSMATSGKATLAIAGKRLKDDTFYDAYSTAKVRLLRMSVDDASLNPSTLRGTLSIDAKNEARYDFAISDIERALPVLATCLEQLRTAYKVGKTDLANIAAQPKGSATGLFSTNDYPEEAISAGQSGTIGVLFWVEATGRVSSCEVIESNGTPVLQQATCDIFKRRARFTPAMDAAGNPVRAPAFQRIRWVMP